MNNVTLSGRLTKEPDVRYGDRPQPTPSDGGFMDIPDGYDDGLPFD